MLAAKASPRWPQAVEAAEAVLRPSTSRWLASARSTRVMRLISSSSEVLRAAQLAASSSSVLLPRFMAAETGSGCRGWPACTPAEMASSSAASSWRMAAAREEHVVASASLEAQVARSTVLACVKCVVGKWAAWGNDV